MPSRGSERPLKIDVIDPSTEQVWEALRHDLPITYLYSPRNIVAMSAKLQGFRPVPDGMIRIQGMEMAK